ncbi:SDR family NAD(P)-dependent oxidoreductase [Candidatus Binatus sp.]|uniref:SDR family NAD(P)-dependent oxidoreductase n=1 Tax=Candidatus Binatus sp. TaxID=2811406 RepID=UPI003C953FE8
MKAPENISAGPSIAIVGMAGRFPGARNLTEFWRNLRDGVESISILRDEQLIAAGATAAELEDPDYVRAAAILEDVDRFDAAFFGLSPRDAAIMDPQHRHFLECAWEALENAGWSVDEFAGRVGVYAGSGMNSYLIHNLLANSKLVANAGLFLLKQTGNDKDVLASRVSYQLNLTGPSLAVQTACSTSLVAIHLACQSLLNHECDMALAGGVTIEIPHGLGYLYREGEILSRDGHCRSFDAASSGTVFGSGLGIVVLRRLEDAVRDGDFIHAVVRGTAINNDGARKVSYLAPSVAGQADAIVEALAVADADADSISYIETHGTGTTVGDPIEIAALTHAFRTITDRNGFCAIGALKTNIGHLDAAAGVAGFIKTVLALEHQQIPPSLNFSKPNPLIDFDHSPFYVNSKLRDWGSDGQPRRAGVTSLGIGGTNAHAILEEAPIAVPSGPSRPWQVLTLSAKTPVALDAMSRHLAEHLEEYSPNLADVAFTGHLGRKPFRFRRAIICKDSIDAVEVMRQGAPRRVFSNSASENDRPLIFLCPGQGSQYLSMSRGLYESEPVIRSTIDFCADYLRQFIGVDLRSVLFTSGAESGAAAELLNQTRLTQPALFVVEYAVAKLWASWGIEPTAMIGHSVGEFAAACIAGVFSLEAGLQIIAERGRLIQSMPSGSMTAVPLPENEVIPFLNGKLSLASVNGDEQCVVSGPDHAIGALEKLLADKQLDYHRLRVSHAFHSSMMDPILREFADFVRRFELAPPTIPYISSATATWITDAEATDPEYWAGQLRQTVRFSKGIEKALKTPGAILLEIGPGNTLSALCEQSPTFSDTHEIISSLRARSDATSDDEFIVRAVGQLWAAGKQIDWKGFHAHERRRRLPLPTYPFERERFWIEPDRKVESVGTSSTRSVKEVREIGYFSSIWKRADLIGKERGQKAGPWLIFEDLQGLGDQLVLVLKRSGEQYITVRPGRCFARVASDRFEIDPDDPDDYQRLLTEIAAPGKFPHTIVHLWSVCGLDSGHDLLGDLPKTETMSFYSLMFLGQALGAVEVESPVQIAVISNNLHRVAEETILNPVRALLTGPCGVIPRELSNVRCRNIDVEFGAASTATDDSLREATRQLVAELQSDEIESPVAYRGNRRWVQTFARSRDLAKQPAIALRDRGVYLITGGLGGMGLVLAESIAKSVRARLVLVGRSVLPPRESWDEWLASHGDRDMAAVQIKKIRAIENIGTEVMVLAGDVCDPDAMRQIADQAHAQFGPINGIIHAAGVLDDAPMLEKDRASAARVLASKVRGTLVLESVFQQDPVEFFFLMSSVSSHLAPAGQVDYTAANAFLDAFARSRSLQGTRFVSIQWPRWTDVGMAAEVSRSPDPAHPLLGRVKLEGQGRTTYSMTLSLEDDWIVKEHRLRGSAGLFPATGYLEMVRAAVMDLTGSSALSISDFYVNQPLRVKSQSARAVQLLVHKQVDGYKFSARTYSDLSHRWLECASGRVKVAVIPRQLPHHDLDELRKRCSFGKLGLDNSPRNEAQERWIAFGPRWRNLKTVWIGRDEALSLLKLPTEFESEVDTYRLHPALLDMASGSAMLLIQGNEKTGYLYVPMSYGSVSISGLLPATCYAYVRSKTGVSIESSIATFDVSILDMEGNTIVEIRDFSVRQIRDVSILESEQEGVGTELEDTHKFEAINQHEMEQPSDAISSEEGARAFEHVLRNPRSSGVVIFPTDFAAYIDSRTAQHTLVELQTPVVAPSGDSTEELEAALIRWWKELLGVESVRLRDNFFELGGQSLTGVRLLTKVRKTYGVDLKLATLFSAPTIEKLCALIRNQTATPASHSLIQIQPNGDKRPLFIIHEIEGSVLVFRELIKHLDRDQPIWGVEYSPGESSAPYLRMEDLAAHYLAQIRQLQPNGPYYFLGYSFGGLLAFEMSQQLRAVGQEVALLGMLDTFLMNGVRASSQRRSLLESMKRRTASLGRHVGRLVFGPQRREYLKEDLAERLDAIVGQGRQFIYGILRARGLSIPKFLHRAKDVNWFAALRYEALPYAGRVTLFRAITPLSFIDMPTDRELGWGPLAQGGVEVHEIPGTHREIMREPNVSVLAHEVSKCLAAAHARHPGDSTIVQTAQTDESEDSSSYVVAIAAGETVS